MSHRLTITEVYTQNVCKMWKSHFNATKYGKWQTWYSQGNKPDVVLYEGQNLLTTNYKSSAILLA